MKNLSNFKKIQVETYSKLAESFDKKQKRENRNHINKIKAIEDFLELKKGDNVLELGVGTGIHADHLLNSVKGEIQYFGIDLSDDMLKKAKERLSKYKNIKLLNMEGEDLKFKDNSFDKVFISGSLHHFENPAKGISEIIRVLKNKGKFCIMEPNHIFPTNFLSSIILPEEKNISLMKKKLFNKWLKDKKINYSIENFAYTPPFPKFMIQTYDLIDNFIKRIPLLNKFSVMLFIKGVKNEIDH
jgi:ubiquinone/menaquinone biosynthesis C-methylase UbiE